MRALRFSTFGGPEVLRIDEVPVPTPGPREVLVRVAAAGLNFADTERRRGLYLSSQALPDTLGFEGAGEVVATGPGAKGDWVGQRVAFLAPRAHADFCVVPESGLIPLPEALTFIQGAAFPVQALTAWQVLHTLGRVQAGEQVLVHSVTGGVGHLLAQLAHEVGARVIGSVSRPGKIPQSLAEHTLVRGDGFIEALLQLAPKGVDLLLEGLGAEAAQTAVKALRPWGRWVHYGTASGESPPISLEALLEKSLTVSSYWLRTPLAAAQRAQTFREITTRLVDGRLKMQITTASLEESARAHRRLEGGLTTGKWVLNFGATPITRALEEDT